MQVAIVTVGDELLAGEIDNTNATWIAARLTERGVDVTEITVVPDDTDRIAERVGSHADRYDAVVVTGGLGSTPDDVTVEGVAAALDVATERDDRTYRQVETAVEAIREDHPDFDFDLERAAIRPVGSEPVENEPGIAPGFVCENVFVLPGIPSEMQSTFERIVTEFEGNLFSKTLHSTEAESHLNEVLAAVHDEFDVGVGCYPDDDGEHKRIKVSATDPAEVEAAERWLIERPEISKRE
ncbi:MAG: competence/damage-inducible protein A [Halobacteriales archaeon]